MFDINFHWQFCSQEPVIETKHHVVSSVLDGHSCGALMILRHSICWGGTTGEWRFVGSYLLWSNVGWFAHTSGWMESECFQEWSISSVSYDMEVYIFIKNERYENLLLQPIWSPPLKTNMQPQGSWFQKEAFWKSAVFSFQVNQFTFPGCTACFFGGFGSNPPNPFPQTAEIIISVGERQRLRKALLVRDRHGTQRASWWLKNKTCCAKLRGRIGSNGEAKPVPVSLEFGRFTSLQPWLHGGKTSKKVLILMVQKIWPTSWYGKDPNTVSIMIYVHINWWPADFSSL